MADAENDNITDERQVTTGSPCDEIDLADIFESECNAEVEHYYLDERGSGSEVDSERDEQVETEAPDGFLYGVTPPRNVRRLKEKIKRDKEKSQALINSSSLREFGLHPTEKAELDRRKKRGSTQLTTERAFQRWAKRNSVEVGFNPDGGYQLLESTKSLDIPSIKIESASRFMSLDCVREESTETKTFPAPKIIARSHPRASRSESDPRSLQSKMYLSPHCPEARLEFYRTFSLLIKLGSLAHKQQEKQSDSGSALERQSSEENKKWQVVFSQALWLELQAWHSNRTMEEQDLYLMQARANVDEVLNKVIDFKVQVQLHSDDTQEDEAVHEQTDKFYSLSVCEETENSSFKADVFHDSLSMHCETTETIARRSQVSFEVNPVYDADCRRSKKAPKDGTCSKLKTAIEQVTALFKEIEAIEQLYPTGHSLGEQNKKYTCEKFTQKVETMSLWLNLTRELNHKLYLVAKLIGVDLAQSDLWKDWMAAGLSREANLCPTPVGYHGDGKLLASSNDYNYGNDSDEEQGDDDNGDDYCIDDEDSEIEGYGNEELPENATSSPVRTISYETQTSTPPSRPSRTSSNMSNFVWSSTSRYRPFVDRSIKKMGLIKLGKRMGEILDSTIMKARQVLAPLMDSCKSEQCQCNVVVLEKRQISLNYLEALLNGEDEAEMATSCSCHPHCSTCFGLQNFNGRKWTDEFKEIDLPSFRPLYLFLSRIPLDISHECLRLRLQHRPKGEPSSLSVRQLLRECKEVLLGAVLVKDYYLSLVDGIADAEDENKGGVESDIEEFEQDLQSLLQVYFEYLHNVIHMVQRLPQASKGLKNILEEEWDFVKKRCRHVRGGEVEGGTRFCVMASGLLESTADFLETGLDQCCSDLHDNTDHSEDLRRKVLEACRGFKHLFNEARERASKALGFTKKLRNDLENAAMFSIDVSMAELMTRLEASGHVQVVARHMAGLLMFVPSELIKEKCQIIHLLNSCCVQEELVDQATSTSSGYLLIMPSSGVNGRDEVHTGIQRKVLITPTVDTAISLADIQLGGMILVVHNSKQLDAQRQRFLDSMSLSTSVIKQRTSSQQNIAEALDDLQDASLSLRDGIASVIERVDQNIDLDSMFEMDEAEKTMVYQTYTETMHMCYNFGFEYQKEVARLVFEERREKLGYKLLSFARQWMKFVMSKCERGRGTRPRWANQGLDFLTVACDPKTLTTLSEDEFQELKKEINDCICHVIGSADGGGGVMSPAHRSHSPACASPVFGRGAAPSTLLRPFSWPAGKSSKVPGDQADTEDSQSTQRQLSDPSKPHFQSLAADVQHDSNSTAAGSKNEDESETIQRKDSFAAAPDATRLEKVRHSLKELEERRNGYLREKRVIGRVSSRRRDVGKELASIASRKVPFKWQRGNKIGEGQFGKVYACVNLDTGEMMAVKQIKFQPNDQSEKRDLADEIEMFEGIKHESLVRYYGVELHRDEMFIFMEYCADGTISDVAKLGLPESMIRVYTYQILVAVNVLHEKGIVHRDVKGANIFLSSDGLIKLGDFGSSIKLKNPFHTTYGEISNIRGTVAYMAPEVITLDKGAGYGRAADIWSIGCVVVEMATGKPPWPECENNFAIMYKVGVGATPAIPESLSEEGQDFLLCCFLHDPYERQTASELMDNPFVKDKGFSFKVKTGCCVDVSSFKPSSD